jgi:hypothetical protein
VKFIHSNETSILTKFIRTTINARRECWYIMDTSWLNDWANFVENKDGGEPPGKMTTKGLRDDNGNILQNLRAKIDYRSRFICCESVSFHFRGIPPLIYHIFKELYGKDETTPICRYTVDIYNMPVPDENLVAINKDPSVSLNSSLSLLLQFVVYFCS